MAKPVRPITAQYLDNVALHYLQRFASSSGNLRRVLMRRVERAAAAAESREAGEALRDRAAPLVDALVERYCRSGLLDDAAYAAAKARSLHRRGASLRAIRHGLAQRAVAADSAEEAVAALAAEAADPDLAAALALARRRRLGPFRAREARADHRMRDLAALARAGFAYQVAARVVDADDPAALEAEAAGGLREALADPLPKE